MANERSEFDYHKPKCAAPIGATMRHLSCTCGLSSSVEIAIEAELDKWRGRRFPVMTDSGFGKYTIPWRLVAPFEGQAFANHHQDLETLARRGGLGETELWCVMHGVRWQNRCSDEVAHEWALALAKEQ